MGRYNYECVAWRDGEMLQEGGGYSMECETCQEAIEFAANALSKGYYYSVIRRDLDRPSVGRYVRLGLIERR